MAHKAPGKHYRQGLPLMEFRAKFPDERTAEDWFASVRWPNGAYCPHCDSDNIYTRPEEKRRNQPYRCRSCRKDFSISTGTLMHSSHKGCLEWVAAMYLMTTNLKGVSSMKLHRDLNMTQKTAWMMTHKIRETFDDNPPDQFGNPSEAGEPYFGGLERNKHKGDSPNAGLGAVGKIAVAGAKDHPTNRATTSPIPDANKVNVHGFTMGNVTDDAVLYADDGRAYCGLPHACEAINYSASEYVWCYVNGFAGRRNVRPMDAIRQMAETTRGMVGKKLIYKELVS